MFKNAYENKGIIWFMPNFLWTKYSREWFSRYVSEYKQLSIHEKINFKVERWVKYKRWTKEVYGIKL